MPGFDIREVPKSGVEGPISSSLLLTQIFLASVDHTSILSKLLSLGSPHRFLELYNPTGHNFGGKCLYRLRHLNKKVSDTVTKDF